jgi:hypothetical protein
MGIRLAAGKDPWTGRPCCCEEFLKKGSLNSIGEKKMFLITEMR